jgi:hypothetical protein
MNLHVSIRLQILKNKEKKPLHKGPNASCSSPSFYKPAQPENTHFTSLSKFFNYKKPCLRPLKTATEEWASGEKIQRQGVSGDFQKGEK